MVKSNRFFIIMMMVCIAVLIFMQEIGFSTAKEHGKKASNYIGLSITGQNISYAPGDDGDLQKGVPWPEPRFTDNGDGTVTDNLTGLVWLKNANYSGPNTWNGALVTAATVADGNYDLSDGSVAGDWRLPNLRELQSLIDYGTRYPALPEGHPFIGVQWALYWSSTSDGVNAWGVTLSGGGVGSFPLNNSNCVLYVRDHK